MPDVAVARLSGTSICSAVLVEPKATHPPSRGLTRSAEALNHAKLLAGASGVTLWIESTVLFPFTRTKSLLWA